jgi:hypothetical protein
LFRGTLNDAEQNHPALSGQTSSEDKFTKVLIKRQQRKIVFRASGKNILISRTRTILGCPCHLETMLPEDANGLAGEVLVREKLHAGVSG